MNYSYELPQFGPSGIVGRLLSGWQLTGIVSLQDGQPLNVGMQAPSALGDIGFSQTPNAVAGFPADKVILGRPERYFDPQAFSVPACDWGSNPTNRPCEIGNVGKNTLVGPGFFKMDFGLTHNMKLTEQWNLQFRAEVFNLPNRTNFALPASNVFTNTGALDPAVGRITTTVSDARQIQFGLKLMF
jgi:hypothetical protein